jgi:hypothetical protein
LAFVHVDDVAWNEVIAQIHHDGGPGGRDRRVSAYLKLLEWTDDRFVAFTRYDPGLVVERHGHASDHFVFVVEGELMVGDRRCPAGTLVVLEQGAAFGPLVAGPDGVTFLEAYAGDVTPVPVDKAAYLALLAERGITRLPNPRFTPPSGAPGLDLDGDRWS